MDFKCFPHCSYVISDQSIVFYLKNNNNPHIYFMSLSWSRSLSGFTLHLKSSSSFLTRLRCALEAQRGLFEHPLYNVSLCPPVLVFLPVYFLMAFITICNVCVYWLLVFLSTSCIKEGAMSLVYHCPLYAYRRTSHRLSG